MDQLLFHSQGDMKMNRFAAGIRVVLITIGLGVSGVAFADTQCIGGAPPPCEPIPVTDSRDPLPDCAIAGTCASNDPIYSADGTLTAQASEATYLKLFKTLAKFCKGSTESCTDWYNKVGRICATPAYHLTRDVCIDAAHNQWSANCPAIPQCPVG